MNKFESLKQNSYIEIFQIRKKNKVNSPRCHYERVERDV